jgi:hypothetical protein
MEVKKEGEGKVSWFLSDGFLGALVVLLTAATAFSAYRSSLAGIEGDDLDVEAQKTMILATSSYLAANTEFLEDIQNYDSYRLFSEQDPEESAIYLDRASEALLAGMARPGGPFDEIYAEKLYGDAGDLFSQIEDIEQRANQFDDRVRIYELAGLLFAIGLAATAWAALIGHRRRIRIVFVIVALFCFIAGLAVTAQILFL